jgi:DNA-binding IscR family transcriptional regulator
MQISSRFTLAVHIFTCIDTFQNEYKVTSDFIAGSTNVNPVIIRKILLQLKAAGLVQVARGTGGTTITRPDSAPYRSPEIFRSVSHKLPSSQSPLQ